ncbi:MAG: sugar ABC transporter permease [Chloroflexi bacterium]|nr:sugar ABC transporter permease [Chloroflexota bacterium]
MAEASATTTAVIRPRRFDAKRVLGRDYALAYLMVAPALVVLLGLIAFPFFRAISLSMESQPIGGEGHFIGIGNYATLVQDPIWWLTLKNTLLYTIFGVGLKTMVGLAFALILHQKLKGRTLLRALLFIPWSVPIVVDAFVWRWIYSDLNGILNFVLFKLHIIDQYVLWTSNPRIVLGAIIAVVVWQGTPFYMMNFLAGLQAIPDDQYEAAKIDGAGAFQSFLHVTLPGLTSVLIVVTLLSTIWTSNELQFVYILSSGGPAHMSEIFPTLAFFTSIPGRELGLGAAVALSFFPMMASLIVLAGRFMLRGAEA